MARLATSVPPGEVESEVAERALRRIKDYLARHADGPDEVNLTVEGGGEDEVLVVPRAALTLIANILAHMAEGSGVSIMPMHAMLTTQQAADLLNVSRPYLIGLLEEGKIPHKKVGRHRRILLEDLLDYQRRDGAQRRAAADRLSALSQELSL
jgi:excisionase family DNA binding protein